MKLFGLKLLMITDFPCQSLTSLIKYSRKSMISSITIFQCTVNLLTRRVEAVEVAEVINPALITVKENHKNQLPTLMENET
jgi:hypothetical protein